MYTLKKLKCSESAIYKNFYYMYTILQFGRLFKDPYSESYI